MWRYKSPRHWLELWREVYGPLQKAFDALDKGAREQLSIDLLALIDRCNVATDGTMVVPAETWRSSSPSDPPDTVPAAPACASEPPS